LLNAPPRFRGGNDATFLRGFQTPVNGSQGCVVFCIEKAIARFKIDPIRVGHVLNLTWTR